ncbi:hypothetical protein DSO57_1001975 [Entomophthora muscae]|uniref:Uncharacterized protein n=1 Tax=Entomophthora muscae TaxID=34485 RepID=A0ACC2RNR0_9FUNG|nr:hypothetical protein DSO57_1001975 [Entomophthora muscae]
MIPNSGPWSLLGRSVSYIIKLAPIIWWALPAGLANPHPEPPNAPTYDFFPDNYGSLLLKVVNLIQTSKSKTAPRPRLGITCIPSANFFLHVTNQRLCLLCLLLCPLQLFDQELLGMY